jgi:hypothetical protein
MKADPIDSCIACGSPTYIRITGDLDEALLRRFASGEGRVFRHISTDYAVISFPNFFSHTEAIASFDTFIQSATPSLPSAQSPAQALAQPDDRVPADLVVTLEESEPFPVVVELEPESLSAAE